MGRVNSAKRFLWVALTQQNASYGSRFRINKLELKTINRITFPACNLLTRAESPSGLPVAAGFAQVFLRPTYVKFKKDFGSLISFKTIKKNI
ncbi:hypothetical protein [Leptospira noguchii]|uniref:Uncharacterized protein n=1 Tax=Leptospira noguchii str. 2001034031 TaxID=1193053 RepID=M6Y651_9LEPT|nr:hypothetical protein [Leptospira noguchii]EMO87441.1 hypothetical protein LEP1GSC024_0935 [Leptospira noguchii str. 2001034031]